MPGGGTRSGMVLLKAEAREIKPETSRRVWQIAKVLDDPIFM
jgi:hypothetical protein